MDQYEHIPAGDVRALGRAKPQRGRNAGPAAAAGLRAPAREVRRPAPPKRRASSLLARGFALGLLFCGTLFTISAVMPTDAAKYLGGTWEKTSIGYSADPRVAGYAASGLALWTGSSGLSAWSGGTDIEIVVAPMRQPIDHVEQSAQANLSWSGRTIVHCEVRLDPDKFFALTEAGRQNVVTHELGHCFGLDHSESPSVMMNPLLYGFSGDDAGAIARLYPRQQPPQQPTAAAQQQPAPTPTATVEAPQPEPTVTLDEVPATPAAAEPQAQTGLQGPPVPANPPAPRPYAGPLGSGWTYVTWAAPSATPAACGCSEAWVQADGTWLQWKASGRSNTLTALLPGVSYWLLR